MTEARGDDLSDGARIGVIGVGTIGQSLAQTLLEQSYDVTVYDVSSDATQAAVEAGARLAGDAREASEGRDVVLTALPTSSDVHAVALDPARGILAGMSAPATLIDVTTSSPAAMIELDGRCAAAGIDFLEAPVSGRPPRLTMFVGGSQEALARVAPVIAHLSNNVVHFGETGSGSRAKIVHQLVAFGNFVLACEAFAIAARAGLSLDCVARALQGSRADSAMLPLIETMVLQRDFVDRGGSLAQIAKDMRLVRDLAEELEVESDWVSAVSDVFLEAERSGMGHESAAAVAKVVESRIGSQISSRNGARTPPT